VVTHNAHADARARRLALAPPHRPPPTPANRARQEDLGGLLQKALNQKEFDAAANTRPALRSTTPNATDGPEGLRAFLGFLKEKFPQLAEQRSQVTLPRAWTGRTRAGGCLLHLYQKSSTPIVDHPDPAELPSSFVSAVWNLISKVSTMLVVSPSSIPGPRGLPDRVRSDDLPVIMRAGVQALAAGWPRTAHGHRARCGRMILLRRCWRSSKLIIHRPAQHGSAADLSRSRGGSSRWLRLLAVRDQTPRPAPGRDAD